MLLMVEEESRGGICQAIYRYAEANNKYMNNYDKKNNIISLGLGCKQPVCMGDVSKTSYKGVQMGRRFIRISWKLHKKLWWKYWYRIFSWSRFEVSKKLFNLHKDLPFLPERKKVFDLHEDLRSLLERKKIEKVKMPVCNIENKKDMLST